MRTFGGIGEDIYTQLDPHLFSQHIVLLTAGISYAAIASWSSILEHRGERYDMCILTAPRHTENPTDRDVQRLLHPSYRCYDSSRNGYSIVRQFEILH